ncbi:MAG: EAL domain-containing protein [Burkholderiales bacterium]|nr:EAL domain-containing protein [Burkholderiales bacterium]
MRHLLVVTWPFLAIVILLVWMFSESMIILGSARSYSEGNSNWSKEQKEAVFQLLRYAETHDEADFQRYRTAVAVPLAFKRFRLEMQKPDPDMQVVYQALRDGLTHPDDVESGVTFFRRFHRMPPMSDVIKVWERGDTLIDQLTRTADELHHAILEGDASVEQLSAIRDRMLSINDQLTPMSQEFTRSLGAASRQTQVVLLVSMFSVAALLLPIGIFLSHRTLRRGRLIENALKMSEERFNLAVTGSSDGLWDWKIQTDELYYSPRFAELLGYDPQALTPSMQAIYGLIQDKDRPRVKEAIAAHLETDMHFDVEVPMRTRGGEYRWFRLRGQCVHDDLGLAVRMAGALTDITDKQRAAAELFTEKERAQVTLASIADGVITTDTEGWVEYLNPVAERLTGWKSQEARGLPIQALFRLVHETQQRQAPNPIEIVLNEHRTVEAAGNVMLQRNDGLEIPIVHSAAPIRGRSDALLGVVLVLHDVSRERQYAAKLSYQASHDALTGLINRNEFERRLELALQSAAQIGRHHCIMYLDLDQFKVVNDTCGHAAGDQLMRQVSALLMACLREGDTLGRLGGDEFGVLLEGCAPDAALKIADKLRQTVAEFHFAWSQLRFNISVSIGLVNVDDGLFTLAEVLRAADTACYMAKEKGRNRIQVYHPDDSELTLRQGEMEWVGRIQRALDENRFLLYSQDIVPVGTNYEAGIHCELLVRMVDEHGQLVPPMAFIPAAERYNLMPAVDRWVIRNALATLSRLRAERPAEPIALCAINLSGASISDDRFLEFVHEQLGMFDVPRQSICFEITETAAIANLGKAQRFIEEFRALGCRFSLDDFGAGMSSFAYLKHLEVDFLKIDGGFVKDMADDPIDHAMVDAINSVGHVMGKRTIAEFVDGERVMAALREIGVDYAQGYGVAKPKPFAPFIKLAQVA